MARHDKNRVFQLAFVAAQKAGWEKPLAAALYITAWNSLLDASNCEKCIGDGLCGVAFEDDRQIVELHIEKQRDLGGERYEVRVEPRRPLEKPKPPRRMRFEDVPASRYPALALTYGALTRPLEAAGCRPMEDRDVPASWRLRAAKALAAQDARNGARRAARALSPDDVAFVLLGPEGASPEATTAEKAASR